MTPTATSTPSIWRQALLAFALVLGVFGVLYWDTAASIVGIWERSETFAHGFLVVPIVLWLVWRRRQTLAAIAPAPGVWTGVLLALAGFGWLLGELAAVQALSQLALVCMLVLLVPTLLGYGVAWAIAFPLAFLFFGVPFGEFAMPQLMQWTADFTVLAVRASGVPLYREGLQFIIPTGTWSVIEACSGIRYIIASLTVGTLFAYLNYQTTKRRAVFILVSLLVPVVANWLRAYMIVMLGHLSGNKLATGVDHIIYGWVFFGLVIMLMFWIGTRWSEPEPELPAPAARATFSAVQSPVAEGRWLLAGIVACVVLAVPQAMRWEISHAQAGAPEPRLVAPAELSPGWAVTPEPAPQWQPAFQNPSSQLIVQYGNAQQTVKLYVGYYRSQNAERKLVSSDNALVKSLDPAWALVARGNLSLQIGNAPLKLRTAELRGSAVPGQPGAERLTVWQYYWINGTLTSSDILAKAYTALYSLLGRGDDSAVVIVYAPKGDAGQGEQALDAFMQANATAISAWLRSVKP
jgi:exosortase A